MNAVVHSLMLSLRVFFVCWSLCMCLFLLLHLLCYEDTKKFSLSMTHSFQQKTDFIQNQHQHQQFQHSFSFFIVLQNAYRVTLPFSFLCFYRRKTRQSDIISYRSRQSFYLHLPVYIPLQWVFLYVQIYAMQLHVIAMTQNHISTWIICISISQTRGLFDFHRGSRRPLVFFSVGVSYFPSMFCSIGKIQQWCVLYLFSLCLPCLSSAPSLIYTPLTILAAT